MPGALVSTPYLGIRPFMPFMQRRVAINTLKYLDQTLSYVSVENRIYHSVCCYRDEI